MAASLNIGRVGLDVTVTDVNRWDSNTSKGRTETLRGWLVADTLAEAKALRSELLEQRNRMVAVTYNVDSSLDGFYIQRAARVGAAVGNAPYGNKRFPFSVTLDWLGSEGQVEFQSLITSDVLTNDHGVTTAESEPFLAAPIGHVAFKANAVAFPTARTRTTADSATDLDWYDGIDPDADPSWSCSPANYYEGAAKIYVSGRLRAGQDAPNDPGDFELSNGLVKVTPGGGGSSNGRIEISTYDGSVWDTAISYSIYYNATTEVPEWHYTSILENTAEVVRLRLVRDANDTEGSRAWWLDINLRRGSNFASFVLTWNGSANDLQVRRTATEAATAITPTGATGPVGIRATANDASGNRYVMATPHTHTQDLTNGRLTRSSSTEMAFMIGAEINGTSANVGDAAADLMLQYLGWVSEIVRAVPR